MQEFVVVLGIGLLHGLGLHQFVEIGAEALLRILPDFLLNLFARRVNLLRGVLRNHLARLAADFRTNDRV